MQDRHSDRLVVVLTLAGLVAGLAVWALIDLLPDRLADPRLLLAVTAASGAFLTCFLASVGPLRPVAAIGAGLAVALPVAALLWGASFRFDTIGPFLQSGHPLLAFGLIVALSLPFAIAALRFDQDPTNYTALFENAWGLVTRAIVALAFVTLFWAAVYLSDTLLQLVELGWIEDALRIDWVPYALTGLATGLALAAAHRLSAVIGPDVLIQLLRLLLPLVGTVTTVFLLALAARGPGGLDQLFGRFSAATTMMTMGFGATLLIAAALERGGFRAVQSRFMRGSVAWLALLLPALGALSVLALRARVAQYGWTPDRLGAATAAVILCGYGATYAVSVLLRGVWMQRIRQANVLMAVLTVLAAVLWLNPVLGPQEIAARSLEQRLADDPATVTDRDLRALAHDYGRAGQAALLRIETTAPAPLAARIAEARRGAAPAAPLTTDVILADLADVLALRPAGAAFPRDALAALPAHRLRDLHTGCARTTPGGAPGCVAVLAELVEGNAADAGLVFYLAAPDHMVVQALTGPDSAVRLQAASTGWPSAPADLDAILAGAASLGPVPVTTFTLGNHVIYALP